MKKGFSLLELLLVVAIVGLAAGVATPHAQAMRRRAAMRSTVAQIRAMFRSARMRAVARHVETGVKFTQTARDWEFAVYEDGDGDGVRSDDIAAGRDRRVGPARAVSQVPELAHVELPAIVTVDPDGNRVKAGASPVQFGKSSMCSFSPLGQSTSGTIYFADAARDAWCVRVFGTTARVRLLHYDDRRKRWEEK